MSERWRLVCHACGFRYAPNTAQRGDCCPEPELHVHDLDRPCERCAESPPPTAR